MQLAWRTDEFNTLHVPLHRFGRCTGRTLSCVGLHADCPPPPPPFDGSPKKKKPAKKSAGHHSRKKG